MATLALEYKSSLFQHHPDACDTTLAPVSYCEPGLGWEIFASNFSFHLYTDIAKGIFCNQQNYFKDKNFLIYSIFVRYLIVYTQ